MSTEITVVNDIVEINVAEEVIVIEAPSGAYPLPSGVYSVYGRTGNVVAQDGDYNLTQLGDVTITNPQTGQALVFNGTTWVNNTETYIGTVTSVNMSVPTGLTISGNPITTAGTLALGLASGYVIPTQSTLDAKVPYTGATGNVTLGEYGLTSGYLSFDTTPTNTPTSVGTMSWDTTYLTPKVVTGTGATTLQIGQEEVALVHNNTGSTLLDGQVVYVTGSTGELPSVALASNASEATSSVTFGVVTEHIANGANGFITISGMVNGLNTLAYNEGDALWLGSTPGTITNVKPVAPANAVLVGYMIKKSGGNGSIFVKIQNGYEISELHDVLITNPLNGNILQYDSASGLWKNVAGTTTNITEGTNLYYTDARSRAAFSESVTGLDYNSTTGVLSTSSGYGIPTTANQANWTTAYNDSIVSAAVTGTTTKTLTLTQQDAGTITASWSDYDTAPVTSVFGRTGAITAESGDYTTTLVTEGTNMYYTQARFNTAFSNKTTTDLTEGTNLYYTQTRFNSAFAAKSTTDLSEGTNLYFTTARAQGAISGTSPISVASGVVFISQAGTSTDGYLSSTDWNTFNNKQTAGNYITALTGEVSASGPGSSSATLSNSAVIGKVLTGLNVTGGTVVSTDSILDAFGKVQNQINGLIGGSIYQGTWDASTNTPLLVSSVGIKGYYYIVSVAGNTNLNGVTDWNVGDWAIFDGTAWQKVDNTDAVVSVNGFTGAVSLTTSNISEGSNLYYTDARARGSISAGTGISYNSTTGVVTNSAPDQTVSLTDGTGISTSGSYPNFTITNSAPDQVVSLTGDGTTSISGSYPNFTISSADQYTGTVTSVAASVPTGLVVTGSPITTTGTLAISYAAGYSIPTNTSQSNWDTAYTNRITSASSPLTIASNAISISQANTTTDGYLSSTDWNTFNSKQGALTFNAPLNNTAGTITIAQSSATTSGYLSSTDWSTFNSKQGALTLTTTGSSGSATLVGSTLNVPTYTLAGLGGISLTSLSATSPLLYNNTTGVFSIQQSSGSQAGYLSSADWTTFNSKQAALTNPVTGTGTTNYLPKFTGASTIGNSLIYDNGSAVGIGTISVSGTYGKLSVAGGISILDDNNAKLEIGRYSSGAPNSYIKIGANSNSLRITNAADSADLVTFTNSGNVGIGTSSPDVFSRGYSGTILGLSSSGETALEINSASGSSAYFDMGAAATRYLAITAGSTQTSLSVVNSAPLLFATANTERMRITSAGNVGINGSAVSGIKMSIYSDTGNISSYALALYTNTATDLLNVRGDGYGYLKASAWAYGSDARIKENISYIETGLDKVLKLKPARFDYIDGVKGNIGWIAQDVQEVIPEAVNPISETNDQLTLKSDFIVPYLVAAIQEQNQLITELRQEVDALKAK